MDYEGVKKNQKDKMECVAIGYRDGQEREMRKLGIRENVLLHMTASHSFHAKKWDIISDSDRIWIDVPGTCRTGAF